MAIFWVTYVARHNIWCEMDAASGRRIVITFHRRQFRLKPRLGQKIAAEKIACNRWAFRGLMEE